MPLFSNLEERKTATVAAAAVVLHALVRTCETIRDDEALVKEAFDLAEYFHAYPVDTHRY